MIVDAQIVTITVDDTNRTPTMMKKKMVPKFKHIIPTIAAGVNMNNTPNYNLEVPTVQNMPDPVERYGQMPYMIKAQW